MDKKISNIKERFLYLSDYKGVSKELFFEKIGMTYGSFKGTQKNTALNSDAIDRLLSIYPDIDANWLLTGKGDMLKKETLVAKPAKSAEGIPVLQLEAFAGIGDSTVQGVNFDTIEDRYVIPLFDGVKIDFMIPVRGSSMYPKYSSGDVVACRFIKELLFVQWNKVYVIDTISQGIVMKRLTKGNSAESVVCKSDNKDYDDFEVPVSEIRSVALVIGVIRLE
jgi:phage repressor protein C with HTH and peptisase S24 domain